MKIKLLIFLGLFLGGCSVISLGYSYLDQIILNRLNNYLDLTEPQEKKAKLVIKELVVWHKNHEIPAYLAYLSQLQSHLKENNVDQGLDYAFGQYRVLRDRLGNKMILNLAPFLFNASKSQQALFFQTLTEENDDILEDLAIPKDERIKNRQKDQLKTLIQWVGELTPAQEKGFTGFISSLPDLKALRLKYRRDSQKTIKAYLNDPNHREADFIDRVKSLRLPTPEKAHEYNKKWALMTTQYFNFFKHFLGTLTAKQRAHFIEEIEDLKLDLISI